MQGNFSNDFVVVRTRDGLKGPIVHYPGLVTQSVVDQYIFRRFFSIGDAGLIGGGIVAPDIRTVNDFVQSDGALLYATNAGYCGRLVVPTGQTNLAIPQGVSMAGGFRLSGNAKSFLRLDGDRLVVQAPPQSNKVSFVVDFFGGGPLPKPLSFDTVARVRRLSDQDVPAIGKYDETIEYYNWRTKRYDLVNGSSPALGFEESKSRAGAPNGLDYTQINHNWRARVTVTRKTGSSTDWVAQYDRMNWTWP